MSCSVNQNFSGWIIIKYSMLFWVQFGEKEELLVTMGWSGFSEGSSVILFNIQAIHSSGGDIEKPLIRTFPRSIWKKIHFQRLNIVLDSNKSSHFSKQLLIPKKLEPSWHVDHLFFYWTRNHLWKVLGPLIQYLM